jgi:ACR3 family arsenite transporter
MHTHQQTRKSEHQVIANLSTLDRFLPLWIVLAMALGLLLGRGIPGLQSALDSFTIDNTSVLIAIGLFAMMYPVLARVKYEEIGHLAGDRKLLWLSLVLNWLVGPLLMFALAWIFLADYPEFRTGLIVIGLARCIAMVLIWNDLACGDREAGALLVAVNSIFQILAYALLGTFYLAILPGWLGLESQDVAFSTWGITKAVLIFLGIPLALGYLTRQIGVAK